MTNEHQILNQISENQKATQRDLAHKTGMSLGSVNILLKKLVKKGLIKIEKLNSRSITYMLTPKGFLEKAELTYKSIVGNFRYIKDMEDKIASVVHEEKYKDTEIYISGDKDEVYAILESKLKSLNIKYQFIDGIDDLKNESENKDSIVITWQAQHDKNDVKKHHRAGKVKYINLLDIV